MGVNSKLFRWGIKVSDLCDFCDNYEETYIHLFCKCEKVKPFWVGINHWICEQTETLILLNDVEIIMGCLKEVPPIFELFVTVTKMHIYSCILFGCVPIVQGFTWKMNKIKSIEKYIATKKFNIDKYNKMWLMKIRPFNVMSINDYYVNTILHTIM